MEGFVHGQLDAAGLFRSADRRGASAGEAVP